MQNSTYFIWEKKHKSLHDLSLNCSEILDQNIKLDMFLNIAQLIDTAKLVNEQQQKVIDIGLDS